MSDWRTLHADANLRMASEMLRQQGELNDAREAERSAKQRLAEVLAYVRAMPAHLPGRVIRREIEAIARGEAELGHSKPLCPACEIEHDPPLHYDRA